MQGLITNKHLFFWLLILIIAPGCTSFQPPVQLESANVSKVKSCRTVFDIVDATVAHVADAETSRIPGFPYLRVNRLHAVYAENSLSDIVFDAWVDILRGLAKTARAIEIANLSPLKRSSINSSILQMENCSKVLEANDLSTNKGRETLQNNTRVPDHYSIFSRTAGLYPLSSIPIWLGYKNLRKSQLDDFKLGIQSPKKNSYRPSKDYGLANVEKIAQSMKYDSLGLPILSSSNKRVLLEAFAPVYTIGHATSDDKIGMIRYKNNGLLDVNIGDPVVFHRIAYTRIQGKIYLQLVYTVFFPARTSSGLFDIFAGRLDGLIWRVTLDRAGRPIIYDSIHPCGCYHLFFPTKPWQINPAVANTLFGEPPLAPVTGPTPQFGERVELVIKAGTHYLAGVNLMKQTTTAKHIPYRMAAESDLRSLPTADGRRRSLYGPDGIISQSDRLERFILWPMGITNAGAMRQWGTHATAFIGRRHFDDPFLFDGMLNREQSAD